jgi:hypothetical protein
MNALFRTCSVPHATQDRFFLQPESAEPSAAAAAAAASAGSASAGRAVSRKADVELLIHQHGGECVQNPREDTDYVLAAKDHRHVKVNNMIAGGEGERDLLDVCWLSRCVAEAERDPSAASPPEPQAPDFVHVSPATRSEQRAVVDEFGDYFEEDCTAGGLRRAFLEVEQQTQAREAAAVKLEVKRERGAKREPGGCGGAGGGGGGGGAAGGGGRGHIPGHALGWHWQRSGEQDDMLLEEQEAMDTPFTFFSRVVAWVPRPGELGGRHAAAAAVAHKFTVLDAAADKLRLHGAVVVAALSPAVTHIVMSQAAVNDDDGQLRTLRAQLRVRREEWQQAACARTARAVKTEGAAAGSGGGRADAAYLDPNIVDLTWVNSSVEKKEVVLLGASSRAHAIR